MILVGHLWLNLNFDWNPVKQKRTADCGIGIKHLKTRTIVLSHDIFGHIYDTIVIAIHRDIKPNCAYLENMTGERM